MAYFVCFENVLGKEDEEGIEKSRQFRTYKGLNGWFE